MWVRGSSIGEILGGLAVSRGHNSQVSRPTVEASAVGLGAAIVLGSAVAVGWAWRGHRSLDFALGAS
jgi:hypothetical protein